ncbi:hypothetical protein [uncultured Polaribacter sp.]|uniref:hypothetical protein n=1 Tax=uncultured Polaribacter sp. TaxID=174711 RepID=UPI002601ACFA|nr:hypothetical protein [uncultured Polaribacter sp.]
MKKNIILITIVLFICISFSNCTNSNKNSVLENTETSNFSLRKFGTEYSSKSKEPSVNEISALRKVYHNVDELKENVSKEIRPINY